MGRTQSVAAVFSPVDIRDAKAVDAWIDGIAFRHGRLDALVNNASTNVLKDFRDATDAEWDLVMGVNVKGGWYCARRRAAASQAATGRDRQSHLGHGMKGEAKAFPYNVSKAGLMGIIMQHSADAADTGQARIPLQLLGEIRRIGRRHRNRAYDFGMNRKDEGCLVIGDGIDADAIHVQRRFDAQPFRLGEIGWCVPLLIDPDASHSWVKQSR